MQAAGQSPIANRHSPISGLRLVVKFGGSLLGSRALPSLLEVLAVNGPAAGALVVPGGGPLADEVRRLDRRFRVAASTAHWMAILAMDQLALLIADQAPAARVVADQAEAEAALQSGRLPVLAPFAWMHAADPLPHSWAVTGDSIAAWVTSVVEAEALVLLKSVPGQRLPLTAGQAAGVVDGFFWQVAARRFPVWLLDGREPEGVGRLLETFSVRSCS